MLVMMHLPMTALFDWKDEVLQTYKSKLSPYLASSGYTIGIKDDIAKEQQGATDFKFSKDLRATVAETREKFPLPSSFATGQDTGALELASEV